MAGVGIAIALAYRYAWIPADWEFGLGRASEIFDLPQYSVGSWFSGWTTGDGQAFAVIATDPLGLDQGWRLGYPVYRYSRAGFGWLAWIASLGRAEWVPYGLALVGSVALLLSLWLAYRLRPTLGRKAWIIFFNPALLLAFARDTSEHVGLVALTWAIATGHIWVSAALGMIRPSFLVALVGRWKQVVVGGLAAIGLTTMWLFRFGFNPDEFGGAFDWPLVGYLEVPTLQSTALILFAILTIGRGAMTRQLGWVASGVLVLILSAAVLEDPTNSWRAAGFLFIIWAFGPGYNPASWRELATSDNTSDSSSSDQTGRSSST